MNTPNSVGENIVKGSLVILLFTFLASPAGYLIKILYSRTLSIEMFGLFYAVLAIFMLLTTYGDLGFGYNLYYLVPKFLKKADYKSCWILYKYDQLIEIGFSFLASLILIITANWLTINYFKQQEAQTLIYIFSIYLIINSFLSALEKFFTGLQQVKYFSSMQFARLFSVLIFSLLFFIFHKSKAFDYATSWVVGYTVVAILYYFLFQKKNKFLVHSLEWDKKILKLMLKYALPAFSITFLYAFITSADTIFLTLLKDVREVGVYNIVLPIASISSIFLSPINAFLFPVVSHLMEGEKEKVEKLINLSLKILPFIGLYFALIIIISPSVPIDVLFGQKWLGISEKPLIILTVGYIAALLLNFLTTVVVGMGYINERLKALIIIIIIKVTVTYVLVLNYGVLGATLSSSIIFVLSTYLHGKIIQKSISFSYPLLFYLKLIGFSLLMFFIVNYLRIQPVGLLEFIIFGIIYSFAFLMFGFYLKLFDKNLLKLFVKTFDVKQ